MLIRRPPPSKYSPSFFSHVRIRIRGAPPTSQALRNALKKPGADADVLTRVITTRAEKDLKVIKELYLRRTNTSLAHAVAKETSNDYKNFLLALIGN